VSAGAPKHFETRASAIEKLESQLIYRPERAQRYKYLEYLGTYPAGFLPEEVRSDVIDIGILRHYPKSTLEFMNEHAGNFCVSNPTRENVDISIMKMDAKICTDFYESPHFFLACDKVYNMYREAISSPEMTVYEIYDDINGDASPGIIEIRRGYRKKRDVLYAGIPAMEYEDPDINEVPLWKVSPKIELKAKEDYIDKKKIRTFIIEPFHHFWSTKRFFGHQNKRMKMLGWSYYGFNPYDGGANRLGQALDRRKRKWMLDGKGWDRLLSHLEEVYKIRTRGMNPSEQLDWTVYWLIHSVLVLPNGDKILKHWGNNSGSGNTTSDNIFAMSIVIAMVFSYLGVDLNKIDKLVTVAIFGDDVVGSDDLPCTDEELERAFRYVFTDLFGIILDPFVITRKTEELQFLGFTFTQTDLGFIPTYPLERLCRSFISNPGRMEPDAEFAKITSLMLMSAGHGRLVFNFFRDAVMQTVFSSDCDSCLRLRKMNLDFEIPIYEDVLNWYLGHEGKCRWVSDKVPQVVRNFGRNLEEIFNFFELKPLPNFNFYHEY